MADIMCLSLCVCVWEELTHYLETTDPPALKPTIVKLASVSKRLNAVNASLHQIQARVNRLFIQLSKQKATNNNTNTAANTNTIPGPSASSAMASASSPAAAALAAAVAGSPSASRGNT
ncbi:hypothetical protein AA313_de0206777 [Arthrobotrys entomopaga]|nr:hypothetical protein AA313_de0206777 [Arthrobotrys entomopaga]